MAELLPARSIWGLRLITIVLCLSCISCADSDNWDRQFSEMKTMMSQLDAKISSVDAKLSNLNILEYAFKMNTIDNSLKMVNSRIDQMAVQMDSVKESLRKLPSAPCSQPEPIQGPQLSRSSPTDDNKDSNLAEKLDDYGKKILQSQKDIKASSQEHHQSLLGFFEVVRSGFAKVISKVESLLALEGQLSTVMPVMRQISVTTDFISSEVSNVITDITEIKKSVSNFTKASNVFLETVTEIKRSISFPASQLGQAVEDAKQLQSEMTRLTTVEEKVVKAASLSSLLFAKESLKSLPAEDREMVENLKKYLSDIENVTVPLALSLPYNLENIRAIIGDTFVTLANRTQCRSDQTMKLEISKLKDSISKLGKGSNAENTDAVFAYCNDAIQDLVVKETPNLGISLLKLQAHLQILIDTNKKSQDGGMGLGPQEWKNLNILLG